MLKTGQSLLLYTLLTTNTISAKQLVSDHWKNGYTSFEIVCLAISNMCGNTNVAAVNKSV
jgi:hypothetical protein